MRQLVLKVLTGRVALISGSYGSKDVRVLAPSFQMQDTAVTVRLMAIYCQVQHLGVGHTRSHLTSPPGNQHNPLLLGYLILKTLVGYVRFTDSIHRETGKVASSFVYVEHWVWVWVATVRRVVGVWGAR